jgi:tRNA(Arg) A34 adenosine deaminase TadA
MYHNESQYRQRRLAMKLLSNARIGARFAGSPGIYVMRKGDSAQDSSVHSASACAHIVAQVAQTASSNGTFGVGAALIHIGTGRIVHRMANGVLRPIHSSLNGQSSDNGAHLSVFDPTAHSERRLLTWYHRNRVRLNLPDPSDLLLVTSLDPCVMCAGAALQSGFRVAVVATDELAGVNWTATGEFELWPDKIRQALQAHISYFAIDYLRPALGNPNLPFVSDSVPIETARACEQLFQDHLETIRSKVSGLHTRVKELQDPAQTSLRSACVTAFGGAFLIKLTHPRQPTQALKAYLTQLVQSTPDATNAVAFIDAFGNLLMASADEYRGHTMADCVRTRSTHKPFEEWSAQQAHDTHDPLASALMRTIQRYAMLRFSIANDARLAQLGRQSLCHPRDGMFVSLYAPSPDTYAALMELGAYGSTMEGPLPRKDRAQWQYFLPPRSGSIEQLQALIAALPPYYQETVGIAIEQALTRDP